MRGLCVLGLCGLLVGAIGCAFEAAVVAPMGALYTGCKVPQSTDFEATPAVPHEVGRAHTTYIVIPNPFITLDFAWGDASVEQAAKSGRLSKIYYSDSGYTSVVLGLFQQYTTIVYGE